MTYSNATHPCEVAVDQRTGQIRIERYLIVEDCGTPLNPGLVDGQQIGATVMGISGVLSEHMVYDDSGRNICGTVADYLIPTAAEAPSIEIIGLHSPSRRTPAGIMGMAEGGVMGAIGAVNDALAAFGVTAVRQPLSPDYVRSLLRARS